MNNDINQNQNGHENNRNPNNRNVCFALRETTFDLMMNMMVDEDTLVCIGLFEMYNDIMTLAKRETDQEIRY